MRFDGWDDELYHHGIHKQKWGIRRFQNEDGSLTPAGKERYLKTKREYTNDLNRKGEKKVARLLRSRKQYKRDAAYRLLDSLRNTKTETESSSDDPLYSKEKKETVELAKIGIEKGIKSQARSMSSEELKKAVEKLNLEKQYTELMKNQNKGFISSGAKAVSDIIRKSFDNIGTQLTTYALGAAINKRAGKDIVNPKKGQKDK